MYASCSRIRECTNYVYTCDDKESQGWSILLQIRHILFASPDLKCVVHTDIIIRYTMRAVQRKQSKRRKQSKQRKTRKHMSGGALRSSYGTVVLPKGLRLYHASTSSICKLPEKPVLFMTLHPSEWYMEGAHISVIELQRDVSLLFMVKFIRNLKIVSSLNDFLGKPNSNLAKMNYDNIKKWLPYLEKESLDGWISSIENKTAIEFAIINDSALKLVECLPIQFNWTNSTYNETIVPKNWGTVYPIHTRSLPIHISLHSRFRDQIERYVDTVREEDPYGTGLSVLLDNATISYFDGPVKSIHWNM